MNGLDSISDPVARRLRCTESYPSASGSAPTRLGSTRLGSRDDVSDDWPLTWHADVTITSGWRHPGHAYCACWHHNYVMLTSSLSGSVTWVGSTGIRVGSTHPGEEDAWRVARVASHLAGAWWRVRMIPTSDFDAVFTSGFVSSTSTQWYGQNIILTTFIFEQKIKHHFKPNALIPIVGDSSSPCADRWCTDSCSKEANHTGTQYFTWFGKSPTSTGESPYYLEI